MIIFIHRTHIRYTHSYTPFCLTTSFDTQCKQKISVRGEAVYLSHRVLFSLLQKRYFNSMERTATFGTLQQHIEQQFKKEKR